MKHAHRANHAPIPTDSGRTTEVCECGATRVTKPDGVVQAGYVGGRFNSKMSRGGWHTCDLCTHAFGKETNESAIS